MGFEQVLARSFRMSDAVWQRHTNPWSVWTRFMALPLLVVAIWSRTWFGWWALVPIAVVATWIWLNPRVFPRPASKRNWASKAVLGERVWLNRAAVPVPGHHLRMVRVLTAVTGAGTLALVYGLAFLDVLTTVLGLTVTVLGKCWFLDRMVWLFEDMVEVHAAYREWLD